MIRRINKILYQHIKRLVEAENTYGYWMAVRLTEPLVLTYERLEHSYTEISIGILVCLNLMLRFLVQIK